MTREAVSESGNNGPLKWIKGLFRPRYDSRESERYFEVRRLLDMLSENQAVAFVSNDPTILQTKRVSAFQTSRITSSVQYLTGYRGSGARRRSFVHGLDLHPDTIIHVFRIEPLKFSCRGGCYLVQERPDTKFVTEYGH